MADKFDYYDILSTIVPGTIMLCWIPICFSSLLTVKGPKYPDAFAVLALTILALLIGQIIDAIASLFEPLLFRTFGGKPSDLLLSAQGLDGKYAFYMGGDALKRIKAKLVQAVGLEASDSSLFQYAIQRTDAVNAGRVSRFNSLYAYHRSLVILLVLLLSLFVISLRLGTATTWTPLGAFLLIMALAAILLLAWKRAKQRAFYYAREVLYTIERVLDEKAPATPKLAESIPPPSS
jgi:hypothetical protein